MISQNHPLPAENSPRVSLGLPVYNGQDYLAEAIQSLLAQTYTDFELIISDNASTDQTESICRAFAERDPRIRYYRQPQNRGGMWNFNETFRRSRAPYFKWAAHDDTCAPTYLQRCVEVLDSRPELAWCYAQSAKIDQLGQLVTHDPEEGFGPAGITHTRQAGLPRRGHDSPRPHKRLQGVLLGTSWSADFFGLIRADILRRTCLIPFCYGGEKVLTAELSLHGPCSEIPETLLFTRVHPAASGSDNSAAAQSTFNNRRRKFEFTRLKLLAGFVRAVQHTELSIPERLRCWGVLLQYVLQVKKWQHVARNLLTGEGVGHRKRPFEK